MTVAARGGRGGRAGAGGLAGDRGEVGRERGATHGRAPPRGLDLAGVAGRMRLPRRASTLPGPTSTKRRHAGLVQGEHRLAPAHRAVSAAASSARTSANGSVRRARARPGSAARAARPRRARRGTARRPAPSAASGRRRRRRAAARGGRARGRPPRRWRERVAVAGEHDLAGRVVVGDGDAGVARRSRPPPPSVAPTSASIEPRSSASAISWPRSTTSAQRVVAVEHAGGGQRGELAERVAGGGGTAVELERVPAGEAGAEDRGLGEAGALLDAREGVLADQLGARARAGRGRAARRGRACRGSGCPGRGTARPGRWVR